MPQHPERKTRMFSCPYCDIKFSAESGKANFALQSHLDKCSKAPNKQVFEGQAK